MHRIGRTGRAGMTGVAISFYNDKNRNISNGLQALMSETSQNIPEFLTKKSSSVENNFLFNLPVKYIENRKSNQKNQTITEIIDDSIEKKAQTNKNNNLDLDWFDHE